LQRGDWVDGVRPANSFDRRFRQTEVQNFSFLHEPRHLADRIFDGRLGIDAMLVIKVYGIDAETTQAGLASRAHILRPSVDAEETAVVAAHVAELGRQNDFIAASFDGTPDEFFVRERPVHVGRVEEVDAQLQRAMNGRD
jgi:hypothetical protein